MIRACVVLTIAALGLQACGAGADDPARHDDPAAERGQGPVRAVSVVDSIHPIEEEVRRFRATLPHEPTGLEGGERSIDALVDAWAGAVNRRDHEALRDLAVDRAEFAWFHYPFTPYTGPPYELSPALVWFRLTSRSSRGLTRVLASFQDRELVVAKTTCEAPAPAGTGALHACVVTVLDADAGWVDVRLFGRILERDGRFKFLSYAADL